jgi:hypothetical protein
MTSLQALGLAHLHFALTEAAKVRTFSAEKKTSKSQTTPPKNTDG